MPKPTAGEVTDAMLARLSGDQRQFLRPRDGDQQVPASLITDPGWLSEQVRLRGEIWKIDDQRVLATLWWYSASTALLTPTLTSLALTGVALSPSLNDVVLHHTASSRLHGSHSNAVLGTSITYLGTALRATLETCIEAVAAIGRVRQPPLWAIATDAIANRLLWAAQASDTAHRATDLAAPLIAATNPSMPAPRYTDVTVQIGGDADAHGRARRFVRRSSCCLLYRVPGENMCTSCPRRQTADRVLRLEAAVRHSSP
jgi:ferric iron reductase protein FhuF